MMFILIINQLLNVFKLMPIWSKIDEQMGMGSHPPPTPPPPPPPPIIRLIPRKNYYIFSGVTSLNAKFKGAPQKLNV